MIASMQSLPNLPSLAREANDKRLRAVDLFSGWGGFTQGATDAGINVVLAANHWDVAVDSHRRNHPNTIHSCQELGGDTDYSRFPDFDVLLASPACQGHARAAQPSRVRSERVRRHHDQLRATAWAVIGCADTCEPRAVIVENVEEFRKWRLYPQWRACLEELGYHVQELLLRASHFGAPQRRDRLFVVATRKRIALDLPVVDRGNRRKVLACEPAFGPCIDWDADVDWTHFRDATPAVKDRLTRGRKRFGSRWIGQHVGDGGGLVPLHEPLRTVTTKDQWFIVDGQFYRPLTIRENARAMGFDEDWEWDESLTRGDLVTMCGNSVSPKVARVLCKAVALGEFGRSIGTAWEVAA